MLLPSQNPPPRRPSSPRTRRRYLIALRTAYAMSGTEIGCVLPIVYAIRGTDIGYVLPMRRHVVCGTELRYVTMRCAVPSYTMSPCGGPGGLEAAP
eukprot:1041482-Rhodomonas_salina.1